MNLNQIMEYSDTFNGEKVNQSMNFLFFFKPDQKTNILTVACNSGRITMYSISDHITPESEIKGKNTKKYPKIVLDEIFDKLYGILSIQIIGMQKSTFSMDTLYCSSSMREVKLEKDSIRNKISSENSNFSPEKINRNNFLIVYTIFGAMQIFEICLQKMAKTVNTSWFEKKKNEKTQSIKYEKDYSVATLKEIFYSSLYPGEIQLMGLSFLAETNTLIFTFSKSVKLFMIKNDIRYAKFLFNFSPTKGFDVVYGGLFEFGRSGCIED